jgi:hypothetical protein
MKEKTTVFFRGGRFEVTPAQMKAAKRIQLLIRRTRRLMEKYGNLPLRDETLTLTLNQTSGCREKCQGPDVC